MKNTIQDLITKTEKSILEKDLIIIEKDKEKKIYSYKEIFEEVKLLSFKLIKMGIKKGDKIGLLSENRKEWIITYLSVTSIGAVIIPVSILWENELTNIVSKGDIKVFFTSSLYLEKILSINSKNLRYIINFDTLKESNKTFKNIYEYNSIIIKTIEDGENHNKVFDQIYINPEDTAEILFVSGNLGVELSHKSIIANISGVTNTLYPEIGDDRKLMTIFPFSHLYPTVFGVLLPIYMGWSLITIDTGRMDRIIKLIKATNPNYILMVPLLLERFINRLKMKLVKNSFLTLGLQKIDFIFVAGVKCPENLLLEAHEIGLTVLEGYGVSEMSPFISLNTQENYKNGSVGKPLKNVKIKIINSDKDNIGDLLARGPNMMKGYYNKNIDKKNYIKHGALVMDENGWIHTGDRGYIDKDGYLHITGRSRKIIVTKGGTNIYPEEIEAKLIKSPYISNVKVVSHSDTFNGEYPFAEIELDKKHCSHSSENIEILIQNEIEKLSGEIAIYKIPKSFRIINKER